MADGTLSEVRRVLDRRLDPGDYQERTLATIEPCWAKGLAGTHPYNRCETAEAMDGSLLAARSRVADDRSR